jgi:hypothetical protein
MTEQPADARTRGLATAHRAMTVFDHEPPPAEVAEDIAHVRAWLAHPWQPWHHPAHQAINRLVCAPRSLYSPRQRQALAVADCVIHVADTAHPCHMGWMGYWADKAEEKARGIR